MNALDDARAIAVSQPSLPLPGAGRTRERFDTFVSRTRLDISTGRLLEAHADADAIRHDLGVARVGTGEFWAVWAAESSRAVLTASVDAAGRWTLHGRKPWCSGASGCTHALVTAWHDDRRVMFAVEPGHPSVTVAADDWHAAGMAGTGTHLVAFEATPAVRVADADEYLRRPGFWHGAVGVAACWFGGALRVADRLREDRPHPNRPADDITLMHRGAVDSALWSGAAVLRAAADEIDAHPDDLVRAHAVALRVRAHIESVATEVIDRVGRALGPGPLAGEPAHSQAVADLTVYLRQSHAEHDLRALGELISTHEQTGAP